MQLDGQVCQCSEKEKPFAVIHPGTSSEWIQKGEHNSNSQGNRGKNIQSWI